MKMKTPKFSLLCLFSLCILSINGQVLTLQGNIVDAKTNKGIPYVNIGFPKYSVGTSSNELGGYVIKIAQERLSDTLVFSSIGYATYRVALKDIKPDVLKKVSMQSSDIGLAELVVKSLDANKIIKTVLKKREDNYNTKPVLMQLFCRELTKEKDTDTYYNFTEGILQVYKSSVNKTDDHVRLIKGRKKDLPTSIKQNGRFYPLPSIVNAPTAAVILDIIKSPQFFLMNIDQFSLIHTGYESVNDKMTYIIHFAPKDSSQRSLKPQDADFVCGKMYIDTASKALVRAEFDLSVRGLRLSNLDFRNNRLPIELIKRSYIVNYAEYQDIMYFKSANIENTYIYKNNIATLTNKVECFTTQIEKENVKRIPKKEEIGENESLGENVNHFDDSFWEDYNFIKSTEGQNDTPPTLAQQEDNDSLIVAKTEKKVKEILSIETPRSKSTIFINGNFKEAKALAAKQNKHIFIDVFTDWCKPCKMMAMEAFTNEEIADLMNAFFINVKADAEKSGRDIATKYMVQSYPTTLIVDSLGSIIDKTTGYRGVDDMKLRLEYFVGQSMQGKMFIQMRDLFDKKQRDLNFLLNYAQMRRKLGLSNDAITDVIIKDMPLDTLLKLEYQQYIYQFSHAIQGKTFEFIFNHQDQPMFKAKLKTLIHTNVNIAIKEKDKNYLSKVLAVNTRIINNPSVSEESNAYWTLKYHEKVSKDKTYHESASLLMTRYYLPQLDTAKSQNNEVMLKDYMSKIQQIGFHYSDHVKDKKYLEQMAILINRACEAHACGELLSVYSQLLYRLKETEKAKELMKKAVVLSGNSKELIEIFEKMDKGVY